MFVRSKPSLVVLPTLFFTPLLVAWIVRAQEVTAKVEPARLEILKSARIHEAFASPQVYHMDIPAPASKSPPADLIEVKPAIVKELEKQAVWVPGYWEWDDTAERFVWTTGAWRFPPPGRRWLSGRWIPHEQGFVRTRGAWIPANVDRLSYVSAPPRYKGRFPLPTAIEKDEFWIPGCWVPNVEGKFVWREAIVSRRVEKWEWTPTQYYWTPDGWLFVDGYWDFALPLRGQAFASLQLTNPVYEGERLRLESFAPVPIDAIREADTGEYVYSVQQFPEKVTYVGLGIAELRTPETPVVVERVLADAPLGTIDGMVRRGDLAPAGIDVELIGHSVIATTDSQGRFEFSNVPYGVYHIRAAGPVQNHVKRAYGRVVVSEPTVRVDLELR